MSGRFKWSRSVKQETDVTPPTPSGSHIKYSQNTSRQTTCDTPCTLTTCTTRACPITYPITSLLLLFVACCAGSPAVCTRVCVVCVCLLGYKESLPFRVL